MSNDATANSQSSNPRVPLGMRNGSSTFLIAIIGLATANLVPLIMTVLMDQFDLSLVRTGEIVTWSLLGSAVTALATARWASGAGRRRIAAAGLAVATLGYATAAFAASPSIVIAGFIVGGLGAGATISTSGAAMAAIRNPNRVVATGGLVNRIVVMALLAILPLIGLAQISVFGTMALVSLIGLALVGWLPNAPEHAEPVDVTSSLAIAAPRRITIAGVALLVLFPLWGMSEDAIWAMTGVLAAELGMGEATLGLVLSAAAAAGAVVTLALLVFGARIGRALPLAIVLVLGGICKALVGVVDDPALLATLIIFVNALYAAGFVMIAATAAGLDARGRWAAPLTGAYLVGSSFSPIVGAWLSESLGLAGFGVVTAVVTFVVLVPLVLAARVSSGAERALDRAASRSAEEPSTRAERDLEASAR